MRFSKMQMDLSNCRQTFPSCKCILPAANAFFLVVIVFFQLQMDITTLQMYLYNRFYAGTHCRYVFPCCRCICTAVFPFAQALYSHIFFKNRLYTSIMDLNDYLSSILFISLVFLKIMIIKLLILDRHFLLRL